MSRNKEGKVTNDSMLNQENFTANNGSLIEKTTAVGESKMQSNSNNNASFQQNTVPKNRRNYALEDSFMVSAAMDTQKQSEHQSTYMQESQMPQNDTIHEEAQETDYRNTGQEQFGDQMDEG
jgi:hypothetical protein